MTYKDKDKQREYQRQWLASRRLEWISQNGPCLFCGSDQNLEVDHIDPSEKVSHNVWSWSEERRLDELAKCRVLCCECHKTRSSEYARSQVKHGGNHMYNLGCRCSPCRAFKSHKNSLRVR